MTKVKFYLESGNNVFAFFPEIIDSISYNVMKGEKVFYMSYSNVGQHSACSKDYLKGKKLASPEQYNDLLNELINIGYNDLKVIDSRRNKTINPTIDINHFVASYLGTAAWATADIGECTNFTRQAQKDAKADCLLFIDKVTAKFGEDKAIELLTIPGNDLTYLAPHCFFLNRNGHGTGFWDRENEFGEDYYMALSEISKEMKECDCYHVKGPKSKLTF